jgi:hypothetical protein
MDRISEERILDWWRCSQSVTTIDKCTKTFREHRGIVPISYPGLVNAAMSDHTEPSDAAGVVNNPDASDDPQYQRPECQMLFCMRLLRRRADLQQPITDSWLPFRRGNWESWICSVLKKEAKKRAAEERASPGQEQSRKRASHGCSSALAARRLLSIDTNSCANELNLSFWGYIYSKGHNRLTIKRADKSVYIKQNSPSTAVLPSDCAITEWETCLQLLEDE